MVHSIKHCSVAFLAIGLAAVSTTALGVPCSLHGGGQADSFGDSFPPDVDGTARFGGSLSSDDCAIVDNVEGHWFMRFADGSRLQVNQPDRMSVQIDGVQNAIAVGLATYEDEIGEFFLRVEERGVNSPAGVEIEMRRIDDGSLMLDFSGRVERGTIVVD